MNSLTGSFELDIMAIGAHPDDSEIGCGGILARYADEGYKTALLDLTDGEPTPYTDSPEERILESKNAAEILNVSVRETLTLPNRKLFDSFEARIELAKVIRKYKPKLVLSPWGHTPVNASPDHYQSQLITEASVFYSKLSKWEEYFGNLEPHRVSSILYYSTMRETPVPYSSFIVDISNEFETKIEALKAYKSQFKANPNQPGGVIPWITAMGKYYGQMIEKEYGEILYSSKPIELNNLELFF